MNTEQAEQLAAFMVEIPERVSIVNFAHSDPNGSGYLPPSEEHGRPKPRALRAA